MLVKFNQLIFDKFQLNINKSLTLSSLAMTIFKVHYMEENSIFQLLGKVEEDIRESYTGGAVDVFIPHNFNPKIYNYNYPKEQLNRLQEAGIANETLYYYDVNSLYPFCMLQDLPVGRPIAFDGDIRAIEPEATGFLLKNYLKLFFRI